MNTPENLLDHARELLDHKRDVTEWSAPRMAALLARRATETILRTACERHYGSVSGANNRTLLIIAVQVLDDGTGVLLERAWYGLSRACHRHAFELTPQESEVRELIGLVERAGHHC
ncbi:hypothetical protein CDG81_12395 [Actinopolyspora erythraea]|uniref:Uncharacterized protein n=1 Tax=Actinopolyspora erythraea TaxID=414996 RepID=A0A099D517_9ACTN|nr:hypothetical protein [Actinopolyspora erythraea]ASU78953.1 hypothetical protein CDG81_12395 [Actinopolyspora erythraea]KGI81288.1 hypothetical protein IL38_12480 [Actinopolyspora erythraea]